MLEPYRTILEVILTAFFGLNVIMLNSLIKRVSRMESALSTHETAQAVAMETVDQEMAHLRGNYIDRFTEVNTNIFKLERKLLTVTGDIQVSIARIEERQKEKP